MTDALWARLMDRHQEAIAAGDVTLATLLNDAAQRIHPTNALNLDYQDAPPGTEREPLGDNMAGACTLAAAMIDATHAGIGKVPVVIFTFWDGGGTRVIAEAGLVLDQAGWVRFRALFNQTVSKATKAAL